MVIQHRRYHGQLPGPPEADSENLEMDSITPGRVPGCQGRNSEASEGRGDAVRRQQKNLRVNRLEQDGPGHAGHAEALQLLPGERKAC